MNLHAVNFYGELAQLGEHLPCTQGVKGSIPLFSTMAKAKLAPWKLNNDNLFNHQMKTKSRHLRKQMYTVNTKKFFRKLRRVDYNFNNLWRLTEKPEKNLFTKWINNVKEKWLSYSAVDMQVKHERAQGGCLGTRSRRRTWQAAISHGEEHISIDPWMSEWGNPHTVMRMYPILNP